MTVHNHQMLLCLCPCVCVICRGPFMDFTPLPVSSPYQERERGPISFFFRFIVWLLTVKENKALCEKGSPHKPVSVCVCVSMFKKCIFQVKQTLLCNQLLKFLPLQNIKCFSLFTEITIRFTGPRCVHTHGIFSKIITFPAAISRKMLPNYNSASWNALCKICIQKTNIKLCVFGWGQR